MKLRKPWTPEILMECYCVARKKPIRREKTKPQTATVISLWFWGLLACPELYFDWALDNQHSWNISGVHGFLSFTVIYFHSYITEKAAKLACLLLWEAWCGLMVSVQDSILIGQSRFVPWPGHCMGFLGKTLNSHSASLYPGVLMGTGE